MVVLQAARWYRRPLTCAALSVRIAACLLVKAAATRTVIVSMLGDPGSDPTPKACLMASSKAVCTVDAGNSVGRMTRGLKASELTTQCCCCSSMQSQKTSMRLERGCLQGMANSEWASITGIVQGKCQTLHQCKVTTSQHLFVTTSTSIQDMHHKRSQSARVQVCRWP